MKAKKIVNIKEPSKLIITLLSPEDEFIITLKEIFDNRIIIQNCTNKNFYDLIN